MERKLKTVNTPKLREMLRRRFTNYTSLTLAWEMMEYTLLLPQTVGERAARLQNFMYTVSSHPNRVHHLLILSSSFVTSEIRTQAASSVLPLPASLCSKPCQYSNSCTCIFGGFCCSLLDKSLWLVSFSIVLEFKYV
jgi:hypothetical protein